MEIFILLIPSGYIAFAVWAVRKIVARAATKRRKQLLGGGAALLFILIPTADEAWNRLQVVRLCHTDGGYHSYGKVRDVAGFYTSQRLFRIQAVRRLGFDYVERPTPYRPDGELARITMDENGKEIVTPIAKPSARFEFGWQVSTAISAVERREYFVRDRSTGQPLQTYVTYTYRGGWAMHSLFGGFAIRGATCGSIDRPEFRLEKFLLSAIEPPNR